MTDDKSLDILGLKPVAHAFEQSIDGLKAFLGKICMPAAEEYGLLLQDKIRARRAKIMSAILLAAKSQLETQGTALGHVHPRVLVATLEGGAWAEETELQKMWAGLLVSGCTHDGTDDSNITFTDLLSRMTRAQARLLNFACEGTKKSMTSNGLIIYEGEFSPDVAQVLEVAQLADVHQLDIELDRLRTLGLIESGVTQEEDLREASLNLAATALALNLYVRCQGFVGPASDYFELVPSIQPQAKP